MFLVDTRNAEGEPTGLDAQGRVQRVNGWRRVEGRVRGAKGGNSSMANFADLLQDTSAGRLESGASVLPPDAPLPRITDIKVVDGTNTKTELAAYLEAIFAAFGRILGAVHRESYVLVHEVPASAYGYGGVTQEFRFIDQRLNPVAA